MAKVQPSSNKANILLVEDSRVDAAIVKALLMENGDFSVTSVATFKDAISKLMDRPYDAVVLDLGLPDSTGAESIDALKKRFPDVPVIILSGHEEEVAVLRSLNYGAEGFLTKDQADSGDIRKNLCDAIFRKSLKGPLAEKKTI